jgi:hypothetical protein
MKSHHILFFVVVLLAGYVGGVYWPQGAKMVGL